jgi:hypothetical protein
LILLLFQLGGILEVSTSDSRLILGRKAILLSVPKPTAWKTSDVRFREESGHRADAAIKAPEQSKTEPEEPDAETGLTPHIAVGGTASFECQNGPDAGERRGR